ncbi:MAG: methyltransferase domain-containing protein, partial [Asgard group archaeon]|nr:methyltransferase domain-containing protein [Asgard group archaeon]
NEKLECEACHRQYSKQEDVYFMLTEISEGEFKWDERTFQRDYDDLSRQYESYMDEANKQAKKQVEQEFENLLKNLSGSVLDVASGRGILLRYLVTLNFINLVASDVDPNILLYDRKKFLNKQSKIVYTVATDAKHMAFRDESFDSVVTLAGLNNIPHPENAYQEIYRVLKKDGTLFALNMFVDLDSETYEKTKEWGFDRAVNKGQMQKDLEKVGFKKVDIKIISKAIWTENPMDGFPLAGDMKYYGIIIANK